MKSFLIFLFCLLGFVVHSQTSLLESISNEQGLSQGFVPSITQDDNGFLWFATKNGLDRYDGYNFKLFRHNPFDKFSLNNDEIVFIEPAGEFLFVVTMDVHPMLFHRRTNRFISLSRINFSNRFNIKVEGNLGNRIVLYSVDENGREQLSQVSWPSNSGSIIDTVNRSENIAKLITIKPLAVPRNARFIGGSADKRSLWFVLGANLVKQDILTGNITYLRLPPGREDTYRPLFTGVLSVVELQGKIWFFNPERIILHDLSGWHEITWKVKPLIRNYFDNVNGIFWYGVADCVYGINLAAQLVNDKKPDWTLPVGKQVRSLLTDRSGILWIGTNGFGIRKFNPRSGVFKNYATGFSVGDKPLSDGKKFIMLTNLWKGTDHAILINEATGEEKDMEPVIKGANINSRISVNLNGQFWWIEGPGNSSLKRLVRFNPATFQRKDYVLPEKINLNYFVLWAQPGNDSIWLLSVNNIAIFDVRSAKFRYQVFGNHPMENVFALERDKNRNFWLGTANGLIRLIPTAGDKWNMIRLTTDKNNRNSLPDNFIKSLLCDPANPDILWIGTNGRGLCRYDTRKQQFITFNQAGGILPDDVVYSILSDDSHPRNLWISTNKGLTRFNPESGFLQYFTRSDGLQENEFNTFASSKSPDGRLLFGGINGLTIFNPKQLILNASPPELWFTNLSINGLSVSPRDSGSLLSKDIAYNGKIELIHGQNNIAIDFTMTDFISPQRNSFSYYLEGAEEPWIHKGFQHSAQYLNLLPGKYIFRVKGANSNGILAAHPISLEIFIQAPWYLRWPAIVLYLLLFILAGFLFNQYQLIQRLKAAESRRLKNLNEFKDRFFTNITHEFRTPLTVIMGMTQKLINENKALEQPLLLIRRNGDNLLRLINQILDLAKLESHTLKFNFVQGDVLAYLRYISESLHSLANAKNVMLRVSSPNGTIIMDYDPERFLQIIYNLLSNAIKFTPSGGVVTMTALQEEKRLTITVSDTGVGIAANELPYIFDRFFQAKAPEVLENDHSGRSSLRSGGTGIGLSLTRELVHAMAGEISVASPIPGQGSGTIFKIMLPVTNAAPLADHVTNEGTADSLSVSGIKMQCNPESGISILLIEDNPDVMEYLASCLGDRYRLEFAFNGRAGIEKALEFIPDLIVSDVMMPEKDGFEVCDFLKNDERTSHIPIVLLTAKVTMEARIAGLRRGADAYLSKPFHEEELLVWVEQLIARQRMLQTRYANLSINVPVESTPKSSENLALEDVFVVRFKAILDEIYSDPDISAETISAKMGMSRAQLYRKLNSLTGRSVTEHLNGIRLGKAKGLLKTGSMNVSEVAYQVGYNDPKYFGRLFSEAFGVSPSEFAVKSNV
jgi:signal transduction histidine kinase/CheY-like chemotaxis protein/ligand-binding sensor domain-containing protein